MGRGDRRRRHRAPLWRVDRPGRDRAACRRALADARAADRRRPPPLRDRAHLRRRGRRRGRSPLRADVPGVDVGPGPDRLPDAPARRGASRTTAARAWRRSCSATSRSTRSTRSAVVPEGGNGGAPTYGYLDQGGRSLRLRLGSPEAVDRALGGPFPELSQPRHRRAREAGAGGHARADRGRHLAPARAGLRPRPRPGARAARDAASTSSRSCCARRRSSRSRRWPQAGETMPPKSTYFYPKLLTGLLFNPL